MGTRLELHAQLCKILGTGNVYFQSPTGFKMVYPCIVYERSKIKTSHADNRPYQKAKQYTITVIDKNPDSQIPDKVSELSSCQHTRYFVNDGLHHDVFTIYY